VILEPAPAVAGAPRVSLAPGHRVGRDGLLRLRFERRPRGTVVTACRYTVPLQVMAPMALDDPAAVVSVLNPTGGLVGGDRLSVDIDVGPGAHACLTAPSATRVYRTEGPPATQHVRIAVGPDGVVEWVPEHTIPFPGSRLCQRLDVTLEAGARLILVDAFAAGRIARGEAWQFARIESAITVRDAGGWRWLDRLVLDGRRGEHYRGEGITGGHDYFATLAVLAGSARGDDAGADEPAGRAPDIAGDSATPALAALGEDIARDLTAHAGVVAGAGTLARGGLVVRVLAREAHQLLDALDAAWALARRRVLGLPPLALRRR